MMIMVPYPVDALWLTIIARVGIGVSFIGVALELAVMVYELGPQLLFRRTITVFSVIFGACGLARIAEAWTLHALIHSSVHPFGYLTMSLDVMSAICGVSAAVVLFPLAWNATGGHMNIDRM